MGVTVSNVKIVQCMIFRWNSWTTNRIGHVWSRGTANFRTQVYVGVEWILSRSMQAHRMQYTRTAKCWEIFHSDIYVRGILCWHSVHQCFTGRPSVNQQQCTIEQKMQPSCFR